MAHSPATGGGLLTRAPRLLPRRGEHRGTVAAGESWSLMGLSCPPGPHVHTPVQFNVGAIVVLPLPFNPDRGHPTIACPLDQVSVRALERARLSGSGGSHSGSHPAKSRKESGGVWAVTCPGRRHFQAVTDTCGHRPSLIHTEAVTSRQRPGSTRC